MNLKRIILIDDNRVDNLVNRKMLAACGFSSPILIFDNPREAFQWFCSPEGSNQDDARSTLVLLDINMPDLSGFDLLSKLEKEHPIGFPDYLILMLTSSSDIADQIRASNYSRVMGYFHKPLNPTKINQSLLPLLGSLFGKAS
ncbi:response regulator [Luteibaculum oceani]|uniref:Response regulator transcription factor n=1 Tax=Luteibaculum oceani TaxID=1294296 RepID=A0A5C6VJ94_9FLAO|nr:response regulator [Luteibaculum oceani]TXC85317.1 response regulator transcription factor [Luteibaculum oceani]